MNYGNYINVSYLFSKLELREQPVKEFKVMLIRPKVGIKGSINNETVCDVVIGVKYHSGKTERHSVEAVICLG